MPRAGVEHGPADALADQRQDAQHAGLDQEPAAGRIGGDEASRRQRPGAARHPAGTPAPAAPPRPGARRTGARTSAWPSGRGGTRPSRRPTSPTISSEARRVLRRARSPIPAPAASTVAATSRLSAILSFVPNSATITSLDPGGAKSMTAVPTAISGDGAPAVSAATSSPVARAAPAATTPDRAAAPPGGRSAPAGIGRAWRGRLASAGGTVSVMALYGSLPGRDRIIGTADYAVAGDGLVTRPAVRRHRRLPSRRRRDPRDAPTRGAPCRSSPASDCS